MELRTGVEIEAAGLAAERASPAQVKKIAEPLRRHPGARSSAANRGRPGLRLSLRDRRRHRQPAIPPLPGISRPLHHPAPHGLGPLGAGGAARHLELFQREHKHILRAIERARPRQAARAPCNAICSTAAHAIESSPPSDGIRARTSLRMQKRVHLVHRRGRRHRHAPAPAAQGRLPATSAGATCASRPISRPTRNSSPPISPTWRRSRRSSQGVDGIVHLGGHLGRRPVARPSSTPTSSAATICSRRPTAPGSSASCSRPRTTRSASIRAAQDHRRQRHGAARQPLRRQQGVRRGARRASTPTSTACASPASASAMSATRPLDKRRLSIWLKPEDLVQLIRIGLEHPRHPLRDLLRRLRQRSGAGGTTATRAAIGYKPQGPGRGFPRAGDGGAGQARARSGRRPLPGRPVLQRRI